MTSKSKEVTLGDVCDFRAGSVFKLEFQGDSRGEYPFIKVSDMNSPANVIRIQESNNWVDDGSVRAVKWRPIPANAVVFAKIGEALKQNRLRMLTRPTIIDNNMMGAIPKTEVVDPKFLFYGMHQFDFGEIADGTALPYLTIRSLSDLPFPLPPLSKQRAIAHILGTLDDKIELNRRMNRTLEEMAQAVFQDWFVNFGPTRAKMEGREPYLPPELWDLFPEELVDSELGEIPEGWDVKSLGDLSHKPQYGYTASASLDPAIGPKFLRITDINKKDWIEWETVPHCDIGDKDFEKYHLIQNDILIARMADPGHGCMIEEELNAVFASYLIRFRPKHKTDARFLQYWLQSNQYWDLVRERGTGTTRTSLNAKVLGDFELVVPAEPLVKAFSDQARGLRERLVANVNESANLATQRDTMLPKLMSGEFQT